MATSPLVISVGHWFYPSATGSSNKSQISPTASLVLAVEPNNITRYTLVIPVGHWLYPSATGSSNRSQISPTASLVLAVEPNNILDTHFQAQFQSDLWTEQTCIFARSVLEEGKFGTHGSAGGESSMGSGYLGLLGTSRRCWLALPQISYCT